MQRFLPGIVRNIARFLLTRFLLTITPLAAAAGLCSAQDKVVTPVAEGIWSSGNLVVLFAIVNGCEGPYSPMQTLISHDGGESWSASGPRLENGRQFEFMLATGNELWLAGEDTAEGPKHAPFILRYRTGNSTWQESEVFPDASEIRAMAIEIKTGKLLAWIRHVDFESENWAGGATYLHQSVDQGRTWQTVKKVRSVPRSVPGLRFFSEVPLQSGAWRLPESLGAVEHQATDGKWHAVPIPAQICQKAEDAGLQPRLPWLPTQWRQTGGCQDNRVAGTAHAGKPMPRAGKNRSAHETTLVPAFKDNADQPPVHSQTAEYIAPGCPRPQVVLWAGFPLSCK